MGRATGTPRKAIFDGVSYNVKADVNLSFMRSKYEKEATPTSGAPLIKMTKRNQNMESLQISVTPEELEALTEKSESIADITISITLADGSTYKTVGHIFLDNYESDSGTANVTIIPTGDWTPFLN